MAEIKETSVTPPPTRALGAPVDFTEVPASNGPNWFEANQKLIVGIVAGVLAIGALAFFYRKFVQEPAQATAASEMWRAQQLFDVDSFQVALTGRPGSVTGFLDIVDNYGSTPTGNLAKYYAGISYLNLGQYDAAIDFLEDFDADGTLLPITKAGALGDAHAQKGELDRAEAYYEEALDEADDHALLAPYYLKKLGMFRESQGDRAEANTLYSRIRDEFPDSEEAGDIRKYIARTQG